MMGLLCPALSWKLWGLNPSTQLPLTLAKEFFKSNEVLPIPSPHCPWLKCPFSWRSYNTCLALLSGQCPACLHLQPTQRSAPVGNCPKSLPPSLRIHCPWATRSSDGVLPIAADSVNYEQKGGTHWVRWLLRCGSHVAVSIMSLNITTEVLLQHNTTDAWNTVLAKEEWSTR